MKHNAALEKEGIFGMQMWNNLHTAFFFFLDFVYLFEGEAQKEGLRVPGGDSLKRGINWGGGQRLLEQHRLVGIMGLCSHLA